MAGSDSIETVDAAGIRWRVLRAGTGPCVLLLHGSGATVHSWAGLLPALAERYTVVAPDLPGHGLTELPPPERMSLPAIADAVAALLHTLGAEPALVVGHSAGAAIGVRMTLDGSIAPRAIVGLNPALAALETPLPKALTPVVNRVARTRFVAHLVSRLAARTPWLDSTLRATGSDIPADSRDAYRRFASSADHVNGVLTMMSRWELEPLMRDLPRLRVPLLLVLGQADRWIDAGALERLTRDLPAIRRVTLPGTGHLAHEERPDAVLELILRHAREAGG